MKPIVFLAAAATMLSLALPVAQASPEEAQKAWAQIVEVCKNKEVRLMLLHELTCTPERKRETMQKLKEDPEFREMWDHNLDRS